MIKFYDTSSLILNSNNLFSEGEDKFLISSITLNELENIKSSTTKDLDNKFAVRQLIRQLDGHIGDYEVCVFKESMLTAINYKDIYPDVVFITNDLSLKTIARLFLDDSQIDSVKEQEDDYKGYTIHQFKDNSEMEFFYQNYHTMKIFYDVLPNEYLLLQNPEGEIIDRLLWDGQKYRAINFEVFDSKQFGRIKPIDIYQQLVADSFTHNKITMVRGPAGTGKSLLALGYLFNQLEKNKIDKIIIFCNTVAAKGAAKLGYYPGSREEKLLDSQIGNFLSSKVGSRVELERLLNNESIILLPMADIRGYDTTGMRAGIYITEAQNMDISLMKLALQRIGEDSICIIDGDDRTQVDDATFAGIHNGMKRVSQVFRGHNIYGEVTLGEIHRSEIARIEQKL